MQCRYRSDCYENWRKLTGSNRLTLLHRFAYIGIFPQRRGIHYISLSHLSYSSLPGLSHFFHCCLPVELPSNLLLAAKNRHYTMLATIMKQRWVTLVNSHPLVDLLAACGCVLTSVNTHPQARVPPLFQHWFSMTFPWSKNENPWPIGTTCISK